MRNVKNSHKVLQKIIIYDKLCLSETLPITLPISRVYQVGGEMLLTIKDIARISGYAVSTVSRALNDHPDINPETKKRICRIVEEYNYSPNRNARFLKQSSGKNVLLIVKGNANLFFTPILEQIQSSAGKKGLSVTVSYISENDNEITEAVRICEEMKPMGIIFIGGNVCIFQRDFSKLSAPCVLCTAYAGKLGFANLSSVSVDDFQGGKAAATKLCKLGHRRIGILSGDNKSEGPFRERFSGICNALSEYGIDEAGKFTEICEFSFRSAYEKAYKLISEHSDLTAVIAMSDIIAIGAVRAFSDMRLKIPDDISVIGFDGLELAKFYTPRITTFYQPVDKLADISVKKLVEMIENNDEASHILLEAEYVSGETTKKREI